MLMLHSPSRRQSDSSKNAVVPKFDRSFILIAVFACIGLLLASRLFVLQIIKHDYYVKTARQEQVKRLELPAERGSISILDGDQPLQVAANETKYQILADPAFVKETKVTASKLAGVLKLDAGDIETKLKRPSRYEIIAKRVDKSAKDQVMALKLKGIVFKQQRVRTYPQGSIAPHVLGFVNDDGEGQYGVEGALQSKLQGTTGQIKAVTDIYGTPLLVNDDNIVKPSVPGDNIVLTIDQAMQRIAEEDIQKGVEASGAKSGSIVIMEAHSGRVKAMANFPKYNQAEYSSVTDPGLFQNRAVSEPLEPGSIMKTLTVSSALDQGLITTESTYYDSGSATVDGITTRNALEFGAGQTSIFDILKNSLNTGAIYLMQLMGGGEINQKARNAWHDYMTRFGFGSKTGIELQEEAAGFVPSPDEISGIDIQYANSAFGQGVSLTITQMAAAVSSVVNGGTYYQPTVVYGKQSSGGLIDVAPPVVKRPAVIGAEASRGIVTLMEKYAVSNNVEATRSGYVTGGKTGTAQISKPDGGGYRSDVYNATFAGFVGVSRPEYVVIIRLDEGKTDNTFTGGKSARPVFTAVANGLMNSVSLAPRIP